MSASVNLIPTLYNITCVAANTQYPTSGQALTGQCQYFSIKARNPSHTLRIAFVTGKVATPTEPYFTLGPGQFYNSPEKISCGGATIFVASPDAGAVAEVVEWSDRIS